MCNWVAKCTKASSRQGMITFRRGGISNTALNAWPYLKDRIYSGLLSSTEFILCSRRYASPKGMRSLILAVKCNEKWNATINNPM
nr:hypothetical protein [Tanacetum cinerariifolium]